MRILFIVNRYTKNIDDGYTLRTSNICKYLKKKNNQIFMVHIDNEQDYNDISNKDDLFEKIVPVPFEYYNTKRGKLYKFLVSFFQFVTYYTPNEIRSFHKEIKKIVQYYNIDIIHVQGNFIGLSLIGFQEVPMLLDITDSMTLYCKRKIKKSQNIKNQLKNLFYSNWYKYIEKRLLKNYKIITVVSESDLLTLKKINEHSLIKNIPNGIDTDFFYPNHQEEEYPSIFFHGTMDFEPNIDAVKYIYNKILPLVKKEIPNLKFFIIGRNPTQEIKRWNNQEDIIVTGKVEDIRSYISKGSIALMPMKSGSGIKNKILEAMAMEKPVITNPLGAESFDEEIKNVLLIGKTELEVAHYAVKLLKNSHMRQIVGKKSRKLVKKYDWRETSQEYANAYKKLLNI